MSRIDRKRLAEGNYPYQCEIQTRFSDLDTIGHINNVSTTSLFQEGRYRMAKERDMTSTMNGQILVIASMQIEFASDLFHTAAVTVHSGLLELGRSSYRLGQIAIQNGNIAAYAEIVQVATENNAAAPFNDQWRQQLERLLIEFA